MNSPVVSRGYGAILCLYFLMIVLVALPLEQAGAYTVKNQTSATLIQVTVTDGNPSSTRTYNIDAGIEISCDPTDTVNCNNTGNSATPLTALVTISAHGGFKCRMTLVAGGTLQVLEKKRPWLNQNYPSAQGYPVDYECVSDSGGGDRSFSLKNRGFDGNPANRDVRFLATGDPQYNNGNESSMQNADTTLFNMLCFIRHVNGCARVYTTDPPDAPAGYEPREIRGIIIAGDLVQNGGWFGLTSPPEQNEWDRYLRATRYDDYKRKDIFGNKPRLHEDHYFYDGLGNHDYHSFWNFQAKIYDHISLRPRGTARTGFDIAKARCVDGFGVPTSCGTPRERPHYSWDWDDVHFVQLNLFPSDGVSDLNVNWGDPYESLSFLKADLRNYVGETSDRPIVLIHHFGLDDIATNCTADGKWEFNPGQVIEYWNAIASYNVAAIIVGHVHLGAGTREMDRGGESPPLHTQDLIDAGVQRRLSECGHALGSRRSPDEYRAAGTFEKPESWGPHVAVNRPDGRKAIPWFNASAALSATFIEMRITEDTLRVTSRKWNERATNSSGDPVPDFVLPIGVTPPAVMCPGPDGFWHSDNVTINCTASDSQGLDCASNLNCSNAFEASFSLSTQIGDGRETDNGATTSHEVCDKWAACATAGPITGFKIDRGPPTVTAPADISVEAKAPLTTIDIGDATAIDSGSGTDGVTTSDADPSGFPVGATVVTWTAIDNVGNAATAMQQVVVVDTMAPIVTVPPDITVEAYTLLDNFTPATATDAVSVVEIKSNPGIYYFPEGETIVTWTAVDAAGNVGTATQRVTATKSGGGAFGLGELLLLMLFGAAGLRRSPPYRH